MEIGRVRTLTYRDTSPPCLKSVATKAREKPGGKRRRGLKITGKESGEERRTASREPYGTLFFYGVRHSKSG